MDIQENFQTSEPLVSVIIPVFNTGEKLCRCFESVITQTWSNLEILVVDDCSTDSITLQIMQEYQQKDSRIKLLHNSENNGAAFSRNLGEESCHGEFFTFLDADDTFDKDFVLRSLQAIQINSTDFVICYKTQGSPNTDISTHQVDAKLEDIPFIHTKKLLAETDQILIPQVIHGKLFRSKTYKDALIKFEPKARLCEDVIWSLSCFIKLNSVTFLPYIGYHHFLCNDSLTRSQSRWKYFSGLDRVYHIYRFCQSNDICERDIFLLFAFIHISNLLSQNISSQDYLFIFQYMLFTLKRCDFCFELQKEKATKLLNEYMQQTRNSMNASKIERYKLVVNTGFYQMIVNVLSKYNLHEIPCLDEDT